jgi:AFG3 family protein
MTPEEKRIVAYHEAGHAVAGWYLQHADPLLKVTIVPRSSGALGFAQYLPKELYLRTKDQLNDMICMALAGRASEQVNFGRVTTGAADDLRRVTLILYQMVQVYGMNDKIGQVGFTRDDSGMFPAERPYSNATAEVIIGSVVIVTISFDIVLLLSQIMDVEVRSMVEEAYNRTLSLIESKKEQVRLIAEYLMEKETITNADVTRLIGAREYSSKEYAQYVEAGSGWADIHAQNNHKEEEEQVGPQHAVAATAVEGAAAAAGVSSASSASREVTSVANKQ